MNLDTKKKLTKMVQEIGQSIIDEADSIVGDYAYGMNLKIIAEINESETPTIKTETIWFPAKCEHIASK